MNSESAHSFVDQLESMGFRNWGLDRDSDMATIESFNGASPERLTVGHVEGYSAGWLTGQHPGELAKPEMGFILNFSSVGRDFLSALFETAGVVIEKIEVGNAADVETYRCVRDDAEVLMEVYRGEKAELTPAIWVMRQMKRRRHFRSDVDLIDDLKSILKTAGAVE